MQRDAALQGGEERLRQEQALLAEGRAALERERIEACDMVKVGDEIPHRSIAQSRAYRCIEVPVDRGTCSRSDRLWDMLAWLRSMSLPV